MKVKILPFPTLALAEAVHGVVGGFTDEAQLAVGIETELRTDVEIASTAGAAADPVFQSLFHDFYIISVTKCKVFKPQVKEGAGSKTVYGFNPTESALTLLCQLCGQRATLTLTDSFLKKH